MVNIEEIIEKAEISESFGFPIIISKGQPEEGDIQDKIEKAIEIICLLNDDIKIMAYIVGSVVRSKARRLSDIDIVLVDPSLPEEETFIDIGCTENDELYKKDIITRILKNLGMRFTILEIRKDPVIEEALFCYGIYKDQIFHIYLNRDIPEEPRIEINQFCR